MKTIRVAVVGVGYWGPNLVRTFTKIPDVEVTWVCDLLPKNREKIRSLFPGIKTTAQITDVIQDPTIDLVSISTPLSSHYQLAKQAILAGKNVLVEKPMTKTSEQAKELIAIAKKQHVMFMVGSIFLYSNPVQEIKKLLGDRILGKPYYFDSTRTNTGLIKKDANVIWDLATHDFSILNYIFPEKPQSVRAFGSSFLQKGREDIAHVIITYKNGLVAHIHLNWLAPTKERIIRIGGSKKVLEYDDREHSEKIKIYDNSVFQTYGSSSFRSEDVTIPHLDQTEPLYAELYHCIDCIQSHKTPITDGREGLKVIQLLEASDASLKTNGPVLLTDL